MCIYGFCSWSGVVARLASSGFDVVVIDLLGKVWYNENIFAWVMARWCLTIRLSQISNEI